MIEKLEPLDDTTIISQGEQAALLREVQLKINEIIDEVNRLSVSSRNIPFMVD